MQLDRARRTSALAGRLSCRWPSVISKNQRQTQSVDDQVNLGRQATTRTTDAVLRGPPFAPAAC